MGLDGGGRTGGPVDRPQSLTVRALDYTARHARALWPTVSHDPTMTQERFADLCRAGLYGVFEGDSLVARFVLRQDGREAVLVAAYGDRPGLDLTAWVLPWIERELAGQVDSIRIHTRRRGLVRKLGLQGYGLGEYVLRKELHDGR